MGHFQFKYIAITRRIPLRKTYLCLNARWGISSLNTLIFFLTGNNSTHIRRFLEKQARRMMTGRGGLSGSFRVPPLKTCKKMAPRRRGYANKSDNNDRIRRFVNFSNPNQRHFRAAAFTKRINSQTVRITIDDHRQPANQPFDFLSIDISLENAPLNAKAQRFQQFDDLRPPTIIGNIIRQNVKRPVPRIHRNPID